MQRIPYTDGARDEVINFAAERGFSVALFHWKWVKEYLEHHNIQESEVMDPERIAGAVTCAWDQDEEELEWQVNRRLDCPSEYE